jgi:flagellar basal-body rod protein FlgG
MNSLYGVPLTGIRGAEYQLDVTANNIANVNTSGFEDVTAEVESLPAQDPISGPPNGAGATPATRIGMGVGPSFTMRSQEPEALVSTGKPLDLAIDGKGFFSVRDGNGQIAYTQQVSLHIAPDGNLVTDQGMQLAPPVRVPRQVQEVTVDEKGALQGKTATGQTVALGALRVSSFASPENMQGEGGGLYTATLGSGRPQNAGAQARVFSGYQLGSNVDLATEMTHVVAAQRQYEINAKSLQTMDSLVNTIVNMQPK